MHINKVIIRNSTKHKTDIKAHKKNKIIAKNKNDRFKSLYVHSMKKIDYSFGINIYYITIKIKIMSKESFDWKLEAFEQKGNLWLRWSTNAPFQAKNGKIRIYSGITFPSNPNSDNKKTLSDKDKNGTWDTGLLWGTGWHCAWTAQQPDGKTTSYIVQVVTDNTMGPNVLKKEE